MGIRSRNGTSSPPAEPEGDSRAFFTPPRYVPMARTTRPQSPMSRTTLGSRTFLLIFSTSLACCVLLLSHSKNWSSPHYEGMPQKVLRAGLRADAKPTQAEYSGPSASGSSITNYEANEKAVAGNYVNFDEGHEPVDESISPKAPRKVTRVDGKPTKEEEDVSPSFSISTDSEDEPHQKLGDNKQSVSLDDLELLELLGHGSVSIGFEARLKGHNKTFMAKVSYRDRDLHFADTEIDMFKILNAEPTIPNIPKLIIAINRIPNPYQRQVKYLTRGLGIDKYRAKALSTSNEISVIAMEFLDDGFWPETIDELRIFLRSLLVTFEFAHSRNVMMCDLHEENVYFDGKMVKIFDWNAAFIFTPNSVIMDYPEAPHHLLPPESKKGNVHRTVSGMDVWTVGLLLRKMIKAYNYTSAADGNDDPIFSQVLDLQGMMLRDDPYERPDATQLLKHEFFSTPDKVAPVVEES